jgi:LmbE family N-acetylglucosaminyl deacetylase
VVDPTDSAEPSDAPRPVPALPEDWQRGLAVAAHPDDLEYGTASAIARWTQQGKQITYLLVTDGEAGIDGMAPDRAGPLRRDEEIRSAAVVGVDTVEFLGHADGLLEADLDLRRDLARSIRQHRPEVLISVNFRETFGFPGWNHVDHRNLGVALLDAARDAGNRWLFTDLLDDGLDPWPGVRFVAFGNAPEPTHAVDVTDSIGRGIASLEEHRVYLDGLPEGTLGTDPDGFLRGMAGQAGPLLGVQFAVPFEVIPM